MSRESGENDEADGYRGHEQYGSHDQLVTASRADPRYRSRDAHVESGKPANLNVLAGFCAELVNEIGDLHLRFADPFLVHEDDIAEVGFDFSGDDLGDEGLGLSRGPHLILERKTFRVDHVGRERISAHGDRRGGRDVFGQLLARFAKSFVRATKSVSQLTSTSAASLPL